MSKKQIFADGHTLAVGNKITWEEGSFQRDYGANFWLAHRVDLHSELKLLASRLEGPGKPVKIETGCEVVGYVSFYLFFVFRFYRS